MGSKLTKEREMKREVSPCTPYKRKAKGKEIPDGDGCVCDYSLRPRGRARGRHAGARAQGKRQMVEKWLDAIFQCGVEDPIPAAVSEAIRLFGCEDDRKIWTWYANRIGVNTFLDRMFEVDSCHRAGELRRPAAAFHLRLKRLLPKGGHA